MLINSSAARRGSGDAREPVRFTTGGSLQGVERLFDRPAAVDDAARGLGRGEGVAVAGEEDVAADERAADVRAGLESRRQLAQEGAHVAYGLAAEQEDGQRRRTRHHLVVLAVGELEPDVAAAVAERGGGARRARQLFGRLDDSVAALHLFDPQ